MIKISKWITLGILFLIFSLISCTDDSEEFISPEECSKAIEKIESLYGVKISNEYNTPLLESDLNEIEEKAKELKEFLKDKMGHHEVKLQRVKSSISRLGTSVHLEGWAYNFTWMHVIVYESYGKLGIESFLTGVTIHAYKQSPASLWWCDDERTVVGFRFHSIFTISITDIIGLNISSAVLINGVADFSANSGFFNFHEYN